MSQIDNAFATSSKPKRAYKKGNPLSDSERKRVSIARKSETHRNVNVYIKNQFKSYLVTLCEQDGLTQAEFIERLLDREMHARCILE